LGQMEGLEFAAKTLHDAVAMAGER